MYYSYTGEYYKVLGEKDLDAFKWTTLRSLGLILAMTAVKSLRVFLARSLSVGWRRCLTAAMHKLYFANIRYYQLNVLGECVTVSRKVIGRHYLIQVHVQKAHGQSLTTAL